LACVHTNASARDESRANLLILLLGHSCLVVNNECLASGPETSVDGSLYDISFACPI
jgi:hypothetical protein